jgi:hypothetical protein
MPGSRSISSHAASEFYLQAPCFTSREPWNSERIGALALYCCDGRWGEAFDEFCHGRLLIPRYDRWAVPGGPVCLLPRDSDEGYCKGTWQQFDFLVRVHELRRIVLIARYDPDGSLLRGSCGWPASCNQGHEACSPPCPD